MLTVSACCLVVGLWLDLEYSWSVVIHVFILLSVVIVTLPLMYGAYRVDIGAAGKDETQL